MKTSAKTTLLFLGSACLVGLVTLWVSSLKTPRERTIAVLSCARFDIREADLKCFASLWGALNRECTKWDIEIRLNFAFLSNEGPVDVQTDSTNPFASHPGKDVSNAIMAEVMSQQPAINVLTHLSGVYGYRIVVNEQGIVICTGDPANDLLPGEVTLSLGRGMLDIAMELQERRSSGQALTK